MRKLLWKKKIQRLIQSLIFTLLLIGVITIYYPEEIRELFSKNQEKEFSIPEDAVVFTDRIHLVKKGEWGRFDTKGIGDPVSFGGAAFYYLPKDSKNYQEYYNLLKGNDINERKILKFTLGKGTRETAVLAIPIIKIEIPSLEVKERVEKHYQLNKATP